MSSFDRRIARLLTLAITSAALAVLSGCQVKPLYGTDDAVGPALASISFSEADDRIEQEVRNRLIFLVGGGQGEPATPAYDVELNVKSRVIGVLLEMSSDRARAGRVEVSAEYTLRKTGSDDVLKTGRRQAVALVDFPIQEFARIRAQRDAEDRAARELAELIRADLAAALGR